MPSRSAMAVMCPVAALTVHEKVRRQLAICWGVIPLLTGEVNSTDRIFSLSAEVARKEGLVKNGDTVVITAGVPLGRSGSTNLIKAQVIDEDEIDLNKISVGCKVKVYDMDFDEEMEFRIVGSTEANSLQNKISNESPVGRALIGRMVDDVVDVETQAGVIQYKVLEIQRVS